MSFAELMPTLLELNRADKLRVMQLLANELAKEERAQLLSEDEPPVWSPHDAYEAAHILQEALEEAKRNA
jgi:hypothetical protein